MQGNGKRALTKQKNTKYFQHINENMTLDNTPINYKNLCEIYKKTCQLIISKQK